MKTFSFLLFKSGIWRSGDVNGCFCPAGGMKSPHPLIQMPQQNDVIHVCDGPSNITHTHKKKRYPLLWQQRVISKERQHRFVCGMLERFQEMEQWEEEEWEMELRAAPVQISGRWFWAIIGHHQPPTPPPSEIHASALCRDTLFGSAWKPRAEFSCSSSRSFSPSIWKSCEPFSLTPSHRMCMSPSFMRQEKKWRFRFITTVRVGVTQMLISLCSARFYHL